MAATYTAGSTADRDRLRLIIGDTPTAGGTTFAADIDALFQDEELDDLLVQEASVNLAGALALEILASRASGAFDFSADGASFKKGSVADRYMKRATQLRARGRGQKTLMPLRKDAYSDDVSGEEAVTGVGALDFNRGRWDEP